MSESVMPRGTPVWVRRPDIVECGTVVGHGRQGTTARFGVLVTYSVKLRSGRLVSCLPSEVTEYQPLVSNVIPFPTLINATGMVV